MQFVTKKSLGKISYFISTSGEMCASLFLLAIVVFSYTLHTKTAEAGLFSFISDLAGDEVSAQTQESKPAVNSQNMALLQPAVNTDKNPHKGDDYIPQISGNALIAEIGPQGTAMEVQDDISTEISIYTVREGDSLSKIAQLFGVSVNTIIWANDLGKNPIIIKDQVLVILPISGIRYTVKKGDTIRGVVIRYKANLEEVLLYNNLTVSSALKVGDVIIIPDAEPTVTDASKFVKTTKKAGANIVHDAGGAFWPGYFISPVEGGRRSQGLHGYNAVDLAASAGTIIRASAPGTVIASLNNGGWNGGYGNYVIISHKNGTQTAQTLYAHTQKNFVRVGDTVEQGQMIAKVGNTGKSTGPHVHFEIRGAKNPL